MNFNIEYEVINGEKLLVMRPVDQLSDGTYDTLKPYIEGMGGHWRERVQGFAFTLKAFEMDENKKWKELTQFFPTPDVVARQVIKHSGLENVDRAVILEPSAGSGALLKALPDKEGFIKYVVEPDEKNIKELKRQGYSVNECTFEQFYDNAMSKDLKFTHVIMNPPFSQSRDVIHVMKAYDLLKDGGRLVAIVSENSLYYKNRYSALFSRWLKDVNAYIEHVSTGSFKESGTMVDTVIVVINK